MRQWHSRSLPSDWPPHNSPGIPNGSRPELLNRSVSFPARPIRMIVPFPAGGVADATARLLAERLAVRLGVPVEVDNRPGAAGTMAGDVVAKSSSDGHTLLFHQANLLIQPGLEPVPYDVVRDFTPVARVATMPLFLVIDGRLPMQTPQQWVTAVRSSPGSYSYGYGQPGSPSQFYAEYAVRGIPSGVPLVTAKGEAAVVLEMLAGRVSACFCSLHGRAEPRAQRRAAPARRDRRPALAAGATGAHAAGSGCGWLRRHRLVRRDGPGQRRRAPSSPAWPRSWTTSPTSAKCARG